MTNSVMDQYSQYPQFLQWAQQQGVPINEDTLSDLFYQWMTPTVNGQKLFAPLDQTPLDQANPEAVAMAQAAPGGIQRLPDGRYASDLGAANEWGSKNAAQGDFIQNILNSSLPVMALGGALGAYGAFGPEGFLGSNPFSGGLPSPTSDAPSAFAGTMEGANAATGAEAAADTSPYFANAGGANLYDIPGVGQVDLGSLGKGAGGGLDLTGPLTTGTSGGLASGSGFGNVPLNLFGSGISALSGGGGNSEGGITDLLKKAFPNANLGSLLGGALQGGLGYLGARQQQNALKDMQNQWLALGAPSRARYEASFQPGFSVFDDAATRDAATRAADIAARSYSATGGNPFDSQTGQANIYQSVLQGVGLPQLNTYRSQNLTGGQLGVNTAGTAGLQQASQAGGGLNAIGYGLNSALNPPEDIASLLKKAGSKYSISY